MIETILIGKETDSIENLVGHLSTYCPQVNVNGIARSRAEACRLIAHSNPDLVFLEVNIAAGAEDFLFEQPDLQFEMIILHSARYIDRELAGLNASDYLFKPVQLRDLLAAVAHAKLRIKLKKEWSACRQLLSQMHYQSPPNNLIGIPAMEGMEFLKVEEIIRCESLQQFTRVAITDGSGIISSYNIGKFCELLLPYGFFAPHKSHLINLQHIRKYTCEGMIKMRDGSHVPVSRRRKGLFLQRVKHL